MAFSYLNHTPVRFTPTLEALLDTLYPVMASHTAAVDAIKDINSLHNHAVAREYFHPGSDKFRRMTNVVLLQPYGTLLQPHGKLYGAAVVSFKSLDVTDEAKAQEWKKEVDPLIEKMKECSQKLHEILNDESIKAFVAVEREVIAREGS